VAGLTRRGLGYAIAGGALSVGMANAESTGPRRLRLAERPVALLTSANARPTPLSLIDDQFPGAEIRLQQGEPARFLIENALSEPAALRFHGGRLPPDLDQRAGFGPSPIEPGSSLEVAFTPPDAGTFLLRPPPGFGSLFERGLFAPLIVEPRQPASFDREILLVIKDLRIDSEGRIPPYPTDSDLPRLGNLLTLNGLAARLDLEVRPGERLRLRLINASNGRIVPMRIEGRNSIVIALDGQPSEPFDPAEGLIVLAPSGRADVVLDMPLQAAGEISVVAFLEGRPIPIARFTIRGVPIRDAALPRPRQLTANPFVTRLELQRATRVRVPITAGERNQRLIAGRAQDGIAGAPLFSVRRGTTVVLTLDNQTEEAHAVHVHGHATRPLDRLDDGWKPWFVDTALVAERETLQVAFVADRIGRFALSLTTAANGSATVFDVT
jgi:FtsP/CotA-like multicopper oxidase with cupredoxin domain